MTRIGMDADLVEGIGRQLKSSSAGLGSLLSQIQGTVDQVVAHWDGPDARNFQQEWTSSHRPGLLRVKEAVEGLGTSAMNNAADQRSASSPSGPGGIVGIGALVAGLATATTGVRSGATAESGDSVGGAAPKSSSSSRYSAAATDFAAKWNGKYLDYDHAYGNQCFDVFAQYNHDVVGGPNIHAATTGGAKDLYNDFATNGAASHYDRIPGSQQPKPGDVVVWGSGQFGHVGVVTAVTDRGFTALEQNTDAKASATSTGALPHEVQHSFGGGTLLGYLRPKE